jgi:hypothetical protein
MAAWQASWPDDMDLWQQATVRPDIREIGLEPDPLAP